MAYNTSEMLNIAGIQIGKGSNILKRYLNNEPVTAQKLMNSKIFGFFRSAGEPVLQNSVKATNKGGAAANLQFKRTAGRISRQPAKVLRKA